MKKKGPTQRGKDWVNAYRWASQNSRPLPDGSMPKTAERLYHYYLRQLRQARKEKP